MVKAHQGPGIDLDSDKTPPWVIDKLNHLSDAMLNWSFTDDLEMLYFCTPESIQKNYDRLFEYFVKAYDNDPNIVETLLMFAIEKNYSLLDASNQIDTIDFITGDTKKKKNNRKRFSLEFGRLTRKKDLIWFINNHWDEISDEMSLPQPAIKKRKGRGASFRDSGIYLSHLSGSSAKKIQDGLEKLYPDEIDKPVDLSTISNVKKRFEPSDDWFQLPRAWFKENNPHKTYDDNFELKYVELPAPHFEFEKI